MKRFLAILLVLVMALSLSACHKHRWDPATCEAPKTCSVCGKTKGDPLGHKWGETSYEWSEDMGSVTAARVCANDPSHIESETVSSAAEALKAPSCTEAGETRFTAEFVNPVFAPQERVEALPAALGHEWGEVSYEWSEDLSSVTATRVCASDPSHVETEIAEVTAEVVKPAGCEEPGETCYSVVFGNEAFAPQSRTEADIEALGHAWGEPSYEWSEDLSSVTASRVCANDPSHIETETVPVEVEILGDAKCGESGELSYSAVFSDSAFAPQSRTEISAAPIEHTWGEPSYEWSEDLSSVTASRVCENDPSHVETETAAVTAEAVKPASCEEPGETCYTAVFENGAFAPQSRTEADIEALGHAWGEASYEWSEDLSSVTASRVCENDPSHVETETAAVTAEAVKPASCEEPGETCYTAVFESEAFAAQSRTEADIEALGHVWGEASYEWSEDLSSVTASRVCENDPSHVETETAAVTAETVKPASCTESGETCYTAVFESEAFAAQSRTEADIEALGHAWGEASYEWSEDLSSVTASRICANDPSHIETETAAVTAETVKPASCTEPGETCYTAAFENEAFAAQSHTEADIEALGHDWLKATHTKPATCSVCGQTEGEPLPIRYFGMSFKEYRHIFNRDYAGFLNIDPSTGKGYTLHVKGSTMTTTGLDKVIRFYHADEFDQQSRKSLKQLKRFNMIEISYLSDSPEFDTSISARIAQLGYQAAKILDPSLGQTAFFKDGLDLFAAKGNEQSFTHKGFVYTLSCSPDGGGYRYVFRMTLADNLE